MISIRKALEQCAKPLEKIDDKCFSKSFYVSQSFLGFEGHFPNKPVLPAVVQVIMAQMAINEATGQNIDLQEITQAKFSFPIEPENTITCTIKQKDNSFWDCSIIVLEKVAAKFSLGGEII